jgi:hypothetical protein
LIRHLLDSPIIGTSPLNRPAKWPAKHRPAQGGGARGIPGGVHRGFSRGIHRGFPGDVHRGGFRGDGHRGNHGGGHRFPARGRRSDVRPKHQITLVARRNNGLGFYHFAYNGDNKSYVGLIAQEVQRIMPQAVVRDHDGYLRI